MARRYTDLELACAVAESKSMSELLRKLGLVPRGANYETVGRRIRELNLSTEHWVKRTRHDLDKVPETILRATVASCTSKAEVLRKLGVRPQANTYTALTSRLAYLDIDTSHFSGSAWNRGRRVPFRPRIPLEEILTEDRPSCGKDLKKRLLLGGLKEEVCELCGLSTWQSAPLAFEIDHINGDRADNRLENLRLLCPNCHSQTETFRGRNIGRSAL